MGFGKAKGPNDTGEVTGEEPRRIRAKRLIRFTEPTCVPAKDPVMTREFRRAGIPVVEATAKTMEQSQVRALPFLSIVKP
jgi:hypothetical protein